MNASRTKGGRFDPTRRRILKAALAAPVLLGASGARAAVPRIVALDYALAETLIAIGAPPLGVIDTGAWDTWVVEPPLPEGTVDVGTGLVPNVELIAALKPDCVIVTDFTVAAAPLLAGVAPVERFSIFSDGGSPLPKAVEATRRLGTLTRREAAADAYLADTERHFAALAERARPYRDMPVLLLSFLDPRHARVYSRPGLQQDVFDRLGLANAWDGEGNEWGFATVGIERLARVNKAFAVADYLPPDVRTVLERSPLWRELPIRRGQAPIPVLPPVLPFGGVPAARRLGSLLVAALEEAAP